MLFEKPFSVFFEFFVVKLSFVSLASFAVKLSTIPGGR